MNKRFLALICVVCIGAFSTLATADDGSIRVIGSAKVSIEPDIANFTFAIDERGMDLASIKSEIDAKTIKVINLAKNLEVNKRDITSSSISIRPQYNHETKEFLGYIVSREVKVTLTKLDKYTDLIDGVIESGITTIKNINLDTSKKEQLELEALERASKVAQIKASTLSKANRVRLGKVINIEENGATNVQRSFLYSARSAEASSAFEPGEISVSATVIVEYAIH